MYPKKDTCHSAWKRVFYPSPSTIAKYNNKPLHIEYLLKFNRKPLRGTIIITSILQMTVYSTKNINT